MYNGWENYETWNVFLWISNDEGLYQIARFCKNYQEFIDHMRSLGFESGIESGIGYETPDGVKWNDPEIDVDEINEHWDEL